MTSTPSPARASLAADWQKRLPQNSSPYTSTIVFLVRKGNPKGIKDWDDLLKPGVAVITPNPKTSGGARWNYLAAWGYALKKTARPTRPRTSSASSIQQVPVLDTGARGADRDVRRARRRRRAARLGERGVSGAARNSVRTSSRSSAPPLSILAEPPVAVVDKVADKKGTRDVAEAYLQVLVHQGRPGDRRAQLLPSARCRDRQEVCENSFAKVELFTIDDVFGGWTKAQKEHSPTAASSIRSTRTDRALSAGQQGAW